MPQPERVFLDWAEPNAQAAARWLRTRAGDALTGALTVVPTQTAGVRLRKALGRGPAPRIVTPAQLLPLAGDDLAHPLEAELTLAAELASARAIRRKALFPAGIPARNFSERLALARNLRSLLAELVENDLTFSEAAARLAPGSLEADRWTDLDRLFADAGSSSERAGLRDRELARLALARDPEFPAGTSEIVVLGIADLQPIVATAFARAVAPVTVVIFGPKEPDAFDAWGRPHPAAWTDRDPGWHDFVDQVQLVARPDSLELDVREVDEIGLLDRELLPGLTEAFAADGRPLHDPTGEPLTAHWFARTLGEFAALVESADFDRTVDLLRNGAVRAWLGERVSDFDAILLAADNLKSRHFPATLRAARPWVTPDLRVALEPIETRLNDLRARPLEAARTLLHELAAAFTPGLEPDEQNRAEAALEAMDAAFEPLRRAADTHRHLSAADWLHALGEMWGASKLYSGKPTDAVEASGWLELPWSDSPHVLLAGMNLGKAPAPLVGLLFLTASTRASLGLPGAAERHARDAYFLARLLALRPPGEGRVSALVGQLDAEGSPLQPSPLLFAGAGDDLPARVERLFADLRPPRPDPAWSADWLLDPPVVEMKRVISATDFERYLGCPFTFYLGRVLKMETFAPADDELDAAQFGDLLHFALEHWATDEAAARSTDPAFITRALHAHVATWATDNLGRQLSLPLRAQIDSARSRLAAFANWQARDRRDGWRIHAVETNFQAILGRPWELAGWTISGRVDRLDENERDGRWRVVDYKTFDSADGPAKKHLRAFRSADRTWPPDYARVPESPQWWINLQLPLYRQLLIESGRDPASVSCGYFNLPKTIAETGLQLWENLDDDLQASALDCARGVLADLDRRRFWPPNSRAAHADFAEFFPPDPLRVVDPVGAFVRSCTP
ncbi:MAG TPA: PD-(D/E)XK nuclease family protein [Chthoniobacterales bacterium]